MQSATPNHRSDSVWPLPISLAATLGIDLSFSSCPYLDVSVQGVPPITLWIHVIVTEVLSAGFPHSDIRGSKVICTSPRLFAAYHVLLRLLVPRHPPYALSCLIFEVILLLEKLDFPSDFRLPFRLCLFLLKLLEYLYSILAFVTFVTERILIRCFRSSSYSRLYLISKIKIFDLSISVCSFQCSRDARFRELSQQQLYELLRFFLFQELLGL